MKKTLSLSLAIAAILSAPTFASDDYRAEISLSHEVGDYGEPDFRTTVISGEYHFDTVNTNNKPRAEAAFVDHSTFIDGSISYTKVEEYGNNDFALGGRYVMNNNIIIEADVQRVRNDNGISVGVGYYIKDNIDIVVSYQDINYQDKQSFGVDSHGVFSVFDSSFISYDAGIAYTDVDNHSGTDLNTNSNADHHSGVDLNAGVTYYFTRSIGLGLDYDYESSDHYNYSTMSLTADYFVTPKIALSAKYSGYNHDKDGNAFEAAVSVRF